MGKLFNVHPSDDQLDLYLVGHLSLEHERLIEEHYIDCAVCLDRLSSIAEFIAVLRTAVQVDSVPSGATVHRTPLARITAMLVMSATTALVCNAPAPSPESPASITLSPSKPLGIQRPQRSVRPPTLLRHSRPYRVFQPPPQPSPPLAAAEVLEIPDDSIIPSDWIGEQISPHLMVQQLEPPPLPPFEVKPRWFRRVLAAVRKGLEPQRW